MFSGVKLRNRKSLHFTETKPVFNYFSLCMSITVLFLSGYVGFKWIKWDAAVIFHKPPESDFNLNPAIIVQDVNNSRWKEKLTFLIETSKEACVHGYEIILNKNLKILKSPVPESFIYLCEKNIEIINLELLEYSTDKKIFLECNDTYALKYRLVKREHPIKFSGYNSNGLYYENITRNYKDTCIIHNSVDLLNSEWYV